MSINDMMKLQGVGGVSRVTSGEQGATPAKTDTAKNTGGKAAPAGGIAVEVGTKIDAGQAPVESGRVAEIRTALQDGSYAVDPEQIADAMIASQLSVVVQS